MKSKLAKKKVKKKKKPPFAAVEYRTVESDEWKRLKKMEVLIFIILKTFYRGDLQAFQAPFEVIKQRSGIKHGGTIDKAVKGLEYKGWIEVIRYSKHGKKRGLRVRPNEYKLTFKYDHRRW